MSSKRFTIIIEKGNNSYGAYVPDVPGLVAVSKSRQTTLELCKEALKEHLKNLSMEGHPIPEPKIESESFELDF